MTEQNQNPAVTDDTEGHGRGNPAADAANLDSAADDTQGHFRRPAMDSGDEDDDTEGHFRKPR